MDNMDDSENNAKISDSAYSNSCSNSQSRRSHSSKSTHSGSHSSGSSGYGGKLSTSGSSNVLSQPLKKDKDSKKKKLSQTEVKAEESNTIEEQCGPPPKPEPDIVTIIEETNKVDEIPMQVIQNEVVDKMDTTNSNPTSPNDDMSLAIPPVGSLQHYVTSRPNSACSTEGFSCVISMHDGVVMYTTASMTTTLGFPKEMWIGRSFIDFVHPKDRNTFASQITNGLAVPKVVNGTLCKANNTIAESTMVCRIRRYRSLAAGFGIKERAVTFMPFMLKLSFKNISGEESKLTYLVIQATPFFSAFKTPNEIVTSPKPFVMRHSASGHLEYIDPESVPYLGYLPQDVQDMDALQLYHDQDLPYLRDIYENIVKEGSVARCIQYRMKAQNGDFLKLETEWSSFINPWSMKLEFVIGKHFIVEGPTNPDVFQSPEIPPTKYSKLAQEERIRAQGIRDNIVKIMNEVLTKPAELAKQCISKRCQDLAAIMENLIADQPKTDDDLRLKIQDADHSYYTDKSRGDEERDSVMLGGISPHHDYDSKSSTETPLSYNQLNYNENLQRYFDSHQPDAYEVYSSYHMGGTDTPKPRTNKCMSTVNDSADSFDMSSCTSSKSIKVGAISPTSGPGDYNQVRLTESLLNRHNAEMEKELVKMRRESRSSTKGEREKASNESRQKKKEHLARCNASFQPTLAGPLPEFLTPCQPQGSHSLKRSKPDTEVKSGDSLRKSRRRRTVSPPIEQPAINNPDMSTTVATTHWSNTPTNVNNAYILGVPPQVPLMSPMPHAVHGIFPMYYTPTIGQTGVITTNAAHLPSTSICPSPFATQMPPMMYGHPVYGQPFVYSPINAQVSYTPSGVAPHFNNDNLTPLSLTNKNYEEACKTVLPLPPRSKSPCAWREKLRQEAMIKAMQPDVFRGNTSTSALNRSAEAVPVRFMDTTMNSRGTKTSDETQDRTDGESSYSSFYSSFFKTDSGSAEESSDQNKKGGRSSVDSKHYKISPARVEPVKKTPRRKMEPPWMEQVCITSELIYKYQIHSKPVSEVLAADKKKMSTLQQPSLVNDQLEQLYLDLQLEGVASRLTLEEGITSSSSSGEDCMVNSAKNRRKKREHSKLVMIYEEDASLPSPQNNNIDDADSGPSTSYT